MVLLGWTLAQKGAEVFLVPMYQQSFEVASLAPDFVLVNYHRMNNRRLVQAYAESGIRVGVLDTEGGIFGDVDKELTGLVERSDPRLVDLYCLWGPRQHESFMKHRLLPREKVFVTGCPRYDFCVAPWRRALPRVAVDERPQILVNTRFPLVFPRFQRTAADEMRVLMGMGQDPGYVRELARQNYLVWAELLRTTADLARSFPEALIVVRPHPFEDRRIYEDVLADLENVKVIQEGTVLPWISASRLLVQRDCSTAVEATFMGVEPVSLEWIEAPVLHNPVSSAVSRPIISLGHLHDFVASALNGGVAVPSRDTQEQRRRIVDDWFYRMDGQSSERVANAILQTVEEKKSSPRARRLAGILAYQSGVKENTKDWIRFLGRRALTPRGYDRIKSRLLHTPAVIAKEFDELDVKQIVQRIADANDASQPVTVERVRGRDTRLKLLARYSVRMST